MSRTLVVSDLHLGTHAGVDVLGRTPALEALLAGLDGIDRLVLLGDTLELRQRSVREVLAAAEPVLRALGRRLGRTPVVLVPGNHDHGLLSAWLASREGPLPLEERCAPAHASAAAERLAELLAPAAVEVAYPGVWLADGVYATHGHYLDLHMTVPTLERIVVAASGRITLDGKARWDDVRAPGDYEAVVAPVYAWIDAVARGNRPSQTMMGGRTVSIWNALRRGRSRRGPVPARTRMRERGLAALFPVAVRALNAAGLGPLRSTLSVAELRRSGLRAMSEVVERLGVDARHVVFGHTHRCGPLSADEPAEWLTPNRTQLHNTGSWVFTAGFSRGPGSPYWPGTAVVVDDGETPRLVAMLAHLEARELAPKRERTATCDAAR